MDRVDGTYRSGKVVLDQSVDWPDGVRVNVVCDSNNKASLIDLCIDGSKWEDTPEAKAQWTEWFDSLNPVFTGRELERFEAELAALREEQKSLSGKWQEKIENLVK
jgi:hypothetical protein